ncbi:MAG TPA: hypothetical protein PKA58_33600, partial [Polyangium sp.]|nr:hypothetical protein [Polyangium sp.]
MFERKPRIIGGLGMNLRKGTSITHIRAFVSERFGPGAWDNFLATIPAADCQLLCSIVSEGWYEMALHVRINRAFCDFFYDGNLAGAEELGRYTAERELALNWRRILCLVRPSFAAKHIGVYWRQEESSGNWTSQLRENEFIAQLSDWQGADVVLYRRFAGYLKRMLEVAGNVKLLDVTHESRNGICYCTFRFEWEIQRDIPLRERIESKEELAEVARELSLFTDVESLAEAVAELIHVQLGYPYVALYSRPVDCEGLTLIREVNCRRTDTPLCVVLQRGGRIIGRLDVESGADSREDLLIELVPMLAL